MPTIYFKYSKIFLFKLNYIINNIKTYINNQNIFLKNSI